uniref:G domain-containing protein n=1 Tax=Babesia bovis TaxID=5865 RepID=A7AV13_BABBO|eukprot:XP_001609207.1 hypothetical protein [Babesia bovis T2Bo]
MIHLRKCTGFFQSCQLQYVAFSEIDNSIKLDRKSKALMCIQQVGVATCLRPKKHIYTHVRTKASLTDFGLEDSSDTLVPGITEDPFFKELNIPKKCIGCGALFQSTDSTKPGYIDSEVLSGIGARGSAKVPKIGGVEVDHVPDGIQVDKCDDGRLQRLKRKAVCRRCYKLQFYKRLEPIMEPNDTESDHNPRESTSRIIHETMKHTGTMKMPEEIERERTATSARKAAAPEVISNLMTRIKSDGLVFFVVDITNVEATALPELYIALRNKSIEVIWVINKVDVLPYRTDLPEIKRWLRSIVRHIGNAKNSDVFMVSSTKGIGFDSLEKRLKESIKIGQARDTYVVGAVNTGKSTFVNRLLHYIHYRYVASTLMTKCSDAGTLNIKRGVGGVTRSATPGSTLGFVDFGLFGGFNLVDTPGIPVASTVTQLLTTPADMFSIAMNKRIDPTVIRMEPGQSLLLGALIRIDFVEGHVAIVHCYISSGVTMETCRTVAASDIMKYKAGVKIYPPHSKQNYEKLLPWSTYRVELNCNAAFPLDDIVLPGLGWLSITGTGPKIIEISAPKGLDILRYVGNISFLQD